MDRVLQGQVVGARLHAHSRFKIEEKDEEEVAEKD
jgi:hypothetical protein